jgi:hypothetical protein
MIIFSIVKSLSKSELVSHPIRVRILGAVGPRHLTSKQIFEELADVPQATLYRHIKILHEAGILEVVGRRQAHGVIEATYALKVGAAHLTREQFAGMSPEDHLTCLAVLQGDALRALGRYVEQPQYDTTLEGMTYLAANWMLTDEESRNLRLDLLDLLARYSQKPPEGRRCRRIAISLIPESKL